MTLSCAVTIMLPSFELADAVVEPVECKAKPSLDQVTIFIEASQAVLKWLALKYQSSPACPDENTPRKAEYAPLDKGVTWHVAHNCYIDRSSGSSKKYKYPWSILHDNSEGGELEVHVDGEHEGIVDGEPVAGPTGDDDAHDP